MMQDSITATFGPPLARKPLLTSVSCWEDRLLHTSPVIHAARMGLPWFTSMSDRGGDGGVVMAGGAVASMVCPGGGAPGDTDLFIILPDSEGEGEGRKARDDARAKDLCATVLRELTAGAAACFGAQYPHHRSYVRVQESVVTHYTLEEDPLVWAQREGERGGGRGAGGAGAEGGGGIAVGAEEEQGGALGESEGEGQAGAEGQQQGDAEQAVAGGEPPPQGAAATATHQGGALPEGGGGGRGGGREGPRVLSKVQVVCNRLYATPAQLVHGFDIDACSLLFDGKEVWATDRALSAWSTGGWWGESGGCWLRGVGGENTATHRTAPTYTPCWRHTMLHHNTQQQPRGVQHSQHPP